MAYSFKASAAENSANNNTLRLEIGGQLDFNSVPQLLAELQPHMEQSAAHITVDLGAVEQANSAALALLVECQVLARGAGSVVEFLNMPDSVGKIAEVCGVSELLASTPD